MDIAICNLQIIPAQKEHGQDEVKAGGQHGLDWIGLTVG